MEFLKNSIMFETNSEKKTLGILLSNKNSPVNETLNTVVQQVDDFLGSLPQEDDMTFIGVEYTK